MAFTKNLQLKSYIMSLLRLILSPKDQKQDKSIFTLIKSFRTKMEILAV